MPKAKLQQNSFTGGIWSKLLAGRNDLAKYGTACERLENFVIWPHGPASFAPGFKYIAETKTSSKSSRLIPFEFSVTQAYILEFGDQYIRFYKDKAQILDGASPYEVSSPYLEADLASIKYCQSADVLYLFHPDYESRKLSRTGHTAWTLSVINWNPQPMAEEELYPAQTLTLSAVTGTGITATAGGSVFIEGDIGRLITSGVGKAAITAFISATEVTCDIIDNFAAVGPIASGDWSMLGSPNASLTPSIKEPKGAICTLTSTIDLFRAADVGKFVRIHSGLVKLTSWANAQSVKGEILKAFGTTDASTSWTLEASAWNATNGYPSCGAFFDDRLFVAGSNANPETLWGSVVGDYESHVPGVDDADAVTFSINGRKVNVIRWIEPRDYLMIGTVGSEWRIGPEDIGEPLTPLNVVGKQVTTKGCSNLAPVTVDGSTLFVQRAGRKIMELAYDFAKGESGGYTAPDLTQLAEHLTIGGIIDIALQQEPIQTLWVAIEDGDLLGFTYLRNEEVLGWHEHPRTGEVESLATIPGTGYDEVWAIQNRTIDGSTVRYVEVMEKVFSDDAETYASNNGLNAFFVDSGITYNGAATSTITGLDHLEGEEVVILGDGAYVRSATVASGQVTINKTVSLAHVGLSYTGTIKPLRMDASLQSGTSQGRHKRIEDMIVRVKDSGPFKVGRDSDNLDTIYDPERELVYGASYPLFSGDLRTNIEDDFNREAQPLIVQDKPMPLTVQAIFPRVQVND